VFKLAALALPIDANPYNHNPPMQEHSQCIKDIAASLSIYCIRCLWKMPLLLSLTCALHRSKVSRRMGRSLVTKISAYSNYTNELLVLPEL
jgi:hypothetical protein